MLVNIRKSVWHDVSKEEEAGFAGDSLLVRRGAVGRHVHRQWDRSAVIEEVHRHGGSAVVGASEPAVKVRQQIDHGAVVHAGSENTGDLDADVGHGVIANNGGVDHERQEGRLVGGRVLLQQRGGVIVADGGVGRALRERGAHEGEGCELEEHFGSLFGYSFRESREGDWRN